MKNNFTKIMQENLQLNEDYKPKGVDYFNYMYGYKRINDKKEEPKEEEPKKTRAELKAEAQEKRNTEIDNEVQEYLNKVEDIQKSFNNNVEKIEDKQFQYELKKADETEESKRALYTREIEKLERQIQAYKTKAENELAKLNRALKNDTKKELRDNDQYIKEIDDLDESFIFDPSLSVLEEKFIFGNMLENIEDVTLMEVSTDVLSGEKLDQSKAKQINNAERNAGAANNRLLQAQKTGNQQVINQAKMDNTRAQLARVQVGALMKEAENPIIAAKEKVIEKKQLAIEKEQAAEQKDMERKKEALDKMKAQVQAVKAKQSDVASTQNQSPVNNQTATTMTEAVDTSHPIKDRIDFNNFSATLFNGGSGNALKYLLKGEINNANVTEIQIAKFMQDKPEVQQVIKKLKFYLRKTASGLSYEEYIDLKVQKGKFRSLFGDAKKEYMNRFKK